MLGVVHPDYLLERLDSKQLGDWEEFYHRVGFGSDRNDINFALMMCCLTGQTDTTKFLPYYEIDDTYVPESKEEFYKRIREAKAK